MSPYRTAPLAPSRPTWWRRLLTRLRCALTWHLMSADTIDAWTRGEVVRCPRCGVVRDYGPRPRATLLPREPVDPRGLVHISGRVYERSSGEWSRVPPPEPGRRTG